MMKAGDKIAELTKQWKEQAATMGMSPRLAELEKLRMQGAPAGQLNEAAALAGSMDRMEKITELSKRWSDEIGMFGMSSHLAEVEKLRRAGVGGDELKQAAAAAGFLDRVEQIKSRMGELESGAKSLIEQHDDADGKARERARGPGLDALQGPHRRRDLCTRHVES